MPETVPATVPATNKLELSVDLPGVPLAEKVIDLVGVFRNTEDPDIRRAFDIIRLEAVLSIHNAGRKLVGLAPSESQAPPFKRAPEAK
jgi:hypothetical protein